MDCIFCKIINREVPSDIIYEDKNLIVFKDIKPKAPIHLLLTPKIHIPSVNDLDEKHKELLGNLFLLAKKIANEKGISDGYKLLFNVGRKGGQLIDHMHLHLLGGWDTSTNI